jgi:hypothetical protein
MDPDQLLKEMIDTANTIQDGFDENGRPMFDASLAEELATAIIELDHWLAKGGFPPRRWTKEAS